MKNINLHRISRNTRKSRKIQEGAQTGLKQNENFRMLVFQFFNTGNETPKNKQRKYNFHFQSKLHWIELIDNFLLLGSLPSANALQIVDVHLIISERQKSWLHSPQTKMCPLRTVHPKAHLPDDIFDTEQYKSGMDSWDEERLCGVDITSSDSLFKRRRMDKRVSRSFTTTNDENEYSAK